MPTLEMIFECASNGDYHLQMDSELFESYLTARIIQAFRNIYVDNKKFILMLVQASYHCRRVSFQV